MKTNNEIKHSQRILLDFPKVSLGWKLFYASSDATKATSSVYIQVYTPF